MPVFPSLLTRSPLASPAPLRTPTGPSSQHSPQARPPLNISANIGGNVANNANLSHPLFRSGASTAAPRHQASAPNLLTGALAFGLLAFLPGCNGSISIGGETTFLPTTSDGSETGTTTGTGETSTGKTTGMTTTDAESSEGTTQISDSNDSLTTDVDMCAIGDFDDQCTGTYKAPSKGQFSLRYQNQDIDQVIPVDIYPLEQSESRDIASELNCDTIAKNYEFFRPDSQVDTLSIQKQKAGLARGSNLIAGTQELIPVVCNASNNTDPKFGKNFGVIDPESFTFHRIWDNEISQNVFEHLQGVEMKTPDQITQDRAMLIDGNRFLYPYTSGVTVGVLLHEVDSNTTTPVVAGMDLSGLKSFRFDPADNTKSWPYIVGYAEQEQAHPENMGFKITRKTNFFLISKTDQQSIVLKLPTQHELLSGEWVSATNDMAFHNFNEDNIAKVAVPDYKIIHIDDDNKQAWIIQWMYVDKDLPLNDSNQKFLASDQYSRPVLYQYDLNNPNAEPIQHKITEMPKYQWEGVQAGYGYNPSTKRLIFVSADRGLNNSKSDYFVYFLNPQAPLAFEDTQHKIVDPEYPALASQTNVSRNGQLIESRNAQGATYYKYNGVDYAPMPVEPENQKQEPQVFLKSIHGFANYSLREWNGFVEQNAINENTVQDHNIPVILESESVDQAWSAYAGLNGDVHLVNNYGRYAYTAQINATTPCYRFYHSDEDGMEPDESGFHNSCQEESGVQSIRIHDGRVYLLKGDFVYRFDLP